MAKRKKAPPKPKAPPAPQLDLTIITVLELISGLFCIGVCISLVLVGIILAATLPAFPVIFEWFPFLKEAKLPPSFAEVTLAYGIAAFIVFLVIGSIYFILIGRIAATPTRSTWRQAVAMAVIGVIFGGIFIAIVPLLIVAQVVNLYYLTKPAVKAYFGR